MDYNLIVNNLSQINLAILPTLIMLPFALGYLMQAVQPKATRAETRAVSSETLEFIMDTELMSMDDYDQPMYVGESEYLSEEEIIDFGIQVKNWSRSIKPAKSFSWKRGEEDGIIMVRRPKSIDSLKEFVDKLIQMGNEEELLVLCQTVHPWILNQFYGGKPRGWEWTQRKLERIAA